MDERLTTLLANLENADQFAAIDWNRAARRATWLAEMTLPELASFFDEASRLTLTVPADRLLGSWLVAAVQARRKAAAAVQARRKAAAAGPASEDNLTTDDLTTVLESLETLYRTLDVSSRAKGQLLAWLTSGATPDDLALFSTLLLDESPEDDHDIMQAFAPLFQKQRTQAAQLFPGLLRAIGSPGLAAPILDLANFLTREKVAAEHPATPVARELSNLLGELVQTLLILEERPDEFGDSPQQLSRRVSRGVALAVSLCDALSLIGDTSSVTKLHQALQVGHRRLRTEAAAALARLGEAEGKAELVKLAAEPIARLRVLAYATELGITDQIEPQYATSEARAQAELCVWLAEPTHYGLPPTTCELFEQRKQHWPGFDNPVDCYLFQFQYAVMSEDGEKSFSNIVIAGPLVHAFVADLADLPAEDIYAAFAGWHAQHEDIREFDVARLSKSEQLEVERLKRRMHDAGYTSIEPQRMGYFFGEKALTATAESHGVKGIVVADFQDVSFFPQHNRRRPLGVDEAYSIYKGRKLLKAFNRP